MFLINKILYIARIADKDSVLKQVIKVILCIFCDFFKTKYKLSITHDDKNSSRLYFLKQDSGYK